jgi:GTP pyrophosphokinase
LNEESRIISEVVGIKSSSKTDPGESKALRLLRDSFVGRFPEDSRVMSVKMAWHEFWGKASRYLSREDLIRCGDAVVFASEAHGRQTRLTGDPYIIHTIGVASVLADMELDADTLNAALLHDVLEDTETSADTLKERFGEPVTLLVDGVTKLGKLPFKSFEDYQAENLRKMFLVMAKDIRVVLIKLADRLHNMRTIQALRREKQLRIARETLEIYAPLAHRLGIYQIKRDLEDLAFKVIDPAASFDIRRSVKKKLPEREDIIKKAIEVLQQRFAEEHFAAFITGRAKHFYSIYEKMRRKNISLEELYDLLALRITVKDVAECYAALGIVHTIWKPLPGQFDDYIANPKSNLYQSLHTAVMGPSGEPLEIQIRTSEMNWIAEYGIAAHWRYKEKKHRIDKLDERLAWIRQALETQSEGGEAAEFLEHVKADVLSTDVFVFTPKGDVVSLPGGATPLDFAYAIHTEVGHKFVGAMVNNRIVPIDYEVQNGDIIKVLTSPQGHPSRDWMKVARSGKARSKIRSWLRQTERTDREEKISRGRELLIREIQRRDAARGDEVHLSGSVLKKIASDLGYGQADELFSAIGGGGQGVSAVGSRYMDLESSQAHSPADLEEPGEDVRIPKRELDTEIVVEGSSGVMVSLANCCKPVPGDGIVGYVTKTRGITIHRCDCPNVAENPQDRKVEVQWGVLRSSRYAARLKLEGADRPGLFAEVAQAITSLDGSITQVRAFVAGSNRGRMTIDLQVRDLEHLYRIIAKLNSIKGVMEVLRG